MQRLLPLVIAAAVLVPSASATAQRGYAFGRVGGNIRPYTITIAATGEVRVSGSAKTGRAKLTAAHLAMLKRIATAVHFESLPAATACPATNPDVAATFVRVGGRTVRVHGTCLARYERMLTALTGVVKLG